MMPESSHALRRISAQIERYALVQNDVALFVFRKNEAPGRVLVTADIHLTAWMFWVPSMRVQDLAPERWLDHCVTSDRIIDHAGVRASSVVLPWAAFVRCVGN